MNRLALFDCDGTLVDSQHNIILCMDDAFNRAGLTPPSREETRRIVGLSLIPAMQVLVPDGDAELPAHFAESLVDLGFSAHLGDDLVLDEVKFKDTAAGKARIVANKAKSARKERKGERRSRGAVPDKPKGKPTAKRERRPPK